MKTFNKNRPLEILIIHSELVCSNDAIQDIQWLIIVLPNPKYLQFEELALVAQELKPEKKIQTDLRYCEECLN